MFSTFRANVPQLFLDIDRDKAEALRRPARRHLPDPAGQAGRATTSTTSTLTAAYYSVMVQAESGFRTSPSDIAASTCARSTATWCRCRTLVDNQDDPRSAAAQQLQHVPHGRYQRPAGTRATAPARRSPPWSRSPRRPCRRASPTNGPAQSLQEIEASGSTASMFGLAIVFVYLFLVAQYESWSLPLVVILSVPSAALGALALTELWFARRRHQPLHPDRPGAADRAGVEECDPDRRVRQATQRAKGADPSWRRRWMPRGCASAPS